MLFLIPSENNKLREERANDLLGRLTVFPVVSDFFLLQVWLLASLFVLVQLLYLYEEPKIESTQRNIRFVVNISPSDELLCSYRQGQPSRKDKIQV